MEGRCPYPYLYNLLQHADETLDQYHKIITNFGQSHSKFEDTSFDKTLPSSSPYSTGHEASTYKRLEEYFSTPLFDNISQSGVRQGNLKDCFLISACIQLSLHPDIVKSLFVSDDLSSGAACLKFHLMERPYYVIIDTLVPFDNKGPKFAHPATKSDSFWFCLLEKAYAKLQGGWLNIGGNSADSLNNILGFFCKTEKTKDLNKLVVNRIRDFLAESNLVFTSIPLGAKAEHANLISNHQYSIFGIDGENLIHLADPHGDTKWKGAPPPRATQVTGGDLWVPVSVFLQYFERIAYSAPPLRYTHAVELNITPGELDGRFFTGPGPHAGCLPQWVALFSAKCRARVYCVAASQSENCLGLCLALNGGDKVNYKKVDDLPIKYAVEGSEIIDAVDVLPAQPYTLCISRKSPATHPVHIYCRVECSSDFSLVPIVEPDRDTLSHVVISGELRPGVCDGRSKFGNSDLLPVSQWRVVLKEKEDEEEEEEEEDEEEEEKEGERKKKDGEKETKERGEKKKNERGEEEKKERRKGGRIRLFIRAQKGRSDGAHTFFIGIPAQRGKIGRKTAFYQEIILSKDSTLEEDFVDIDLSQYAGDADVLVGMTREKEAKASVFSFEIWCECGIELVLWTDADTAAAAAAGNRSAFDQFVDDVADAAAHTHGHKASLSLSPHPSAWGSAGSMSVSPLAARARATTHSSSPSAKSLSPSPSSAASSSKAAAASRSFSGSAKAASSHYTTATAVSNKNISSPHSANVHGRPSTFKRTAAAGSVSVSVSPTPFANTFVSAVGTKPTHAPKPKAKSVPSPHTTSASSSSSNSGSVSAASVALLSVGGAGGGKKKHKQRRLGAGVVADLYELVGGF